MADVASGNGNSEPTPEQAMVVVNEHLHLFGGAEPCESGCRHRLMGSLTALGVANTVRRALEKVERDHGK
jgi:hypothetical protein